MYKIPLFDLNYDTIELQAIKKTSESKWISSGPKCESFEKIFSKKIGVDFSLTTSSCTASLHMALVALEIQKGDEVIVPSLTFAASANVIKYVGAKPVFCDIISHSNLTIDPKEIIRKITDKTKAIIVMHYAGFPCDMNEIVSIAKKHKLFIVEDTAHAPLSEYCGQKLGTFGDIGTFSFFSNKNIATGEGGMIVTKKEKLYRRLKSIRSHGMTTMSYDRYRGHATSYDINHIGYNYRLDDIRASLGIIQLDKLKHDLLKRKKLRELYIQKLSNNKNLIIPFKDHKGFVSNYIFPIVLKNSNVFKRDKVRDKLHQLGIQTSVHYPSIHKFSVYKEEFVELTKTDYVSSNEITLPMYGKLSNNDVEFICNNLIRAIKADERQE